MIIAEITEHTAEWHAARLKNIGGSEIAGLFGVQADYAPSAYTLHMVKSGRIPAPPVDDKPGSRVWFGIKLEPTIAALAAELHGWKLAKGGYCLDDTTPGMACSLDYLITEPGPEEIKLGFEGPGVLQIKNIDGIQFRQKWTADEPPFPILLQLQHEIACSGCTWGVIVGMVGGNELPAYRYAKREKTIALIRKRVTEFWEGVRAKKAPLVDGTDSTAAAIAALYPTLGIKLPLDLTTDNELPEICAGLIVATADRKAAEANENEFKNRLTEKLKGHKNAVASGYAINGVFTPENPGQRAGDLPPSQIIGKRAESIWFKVKELVGA
jgi:predicted phage-related endonuclease